MNDIESLELKISKFLRAGVIVACILLLAGWISQIKFSGSTFYNFQIYGEIPLNELLEYYIRRKEWGVLIAYSGLVILISLPMIRVFLTAFLFLRQKEYVLAGIASIVLISLIVSMLLGIDL